MKFSFIKPLNLESALVRETFKVHGIAWVGVGLALLGLVLLRGEWVLFPGVPLQLPTVPQEAQENVRVEAVLTISAAEILFFKGQKLSLNELKKVLLTDDSIQYGGSTLLLKVDHRISLNFLLQVSEIIREAGCSNIHIACTPKKDICDNVSINQL